MRTNAEIVGRARRSDLLRGVLEAALGGGGHVTSHVDTEGASVGVSYDHVTIGRSFHSSGATA